MSANRRCGGTGLTTFATCLRPETRRKKLASARSPSLESYGVPIPAQAKSSELGPVRPKKCSKFERAVLYQNGRHVFRSQDSSFEQAPDRDLLRLGRSPAGYQAPSVPVPVRGVAVALGPVTVPPQVPPLLPPWATLGNACIPPPLPAYGYAAAGSGLFGGGAPGGEATGNGATGSGGKGAATSELYVTADRSGCGGGECSRVGIADTPSGAGGGAPPEDFGGSAEEAARGFATTGGAVERRKAWKCLELACCLYHTRDHQARQR